MYLQFETGVLGATNSPEFSTRYEWNEVVKLAVSRRLEFIEAISHPIAKGFFVSGEISSRRLRTFDKPRLAEISVENWFQLDYPAA